MMRKFLIKCFLFLCPAILFLVGMEWYARSIPNSYRQKEQWMQHHAQEVEILILGNSHGLYGLRPDVFKRKAYNLCNVSQIFEYDEYLLKRYLPKCKSLTDVVLVVDNSNLFDMPLENTEEFRCIYYRLYMDYPKHSRWSKYGFELSNIQALKKKIQHRNDTCSDLGWNGNYTLERKSLANVSLEAASNTAARHQCKNWQVAEENVRILKRIADLCKQHHLRLILVQAPVTRNYYTRIDKKQLDFIKRSVESIGVPSHDYSQDKHFEDDDFFDADHLTDKGAIKWSFLLYNQYFRE